MSRRERLHPSAGGDPTIRILARSGTAFNQPAGTASTNHFPQYALSGLAPGNLKNRFDPRIATVQAQIAGSSKPSGSICIVT